MTRLALAGLILACALAIMPAFAVTPTCATRAVTVEVLARFGQTPRAIGMDDYGGVMELYADSAGNWTIVANRPDGMTCLFATGTDLEVLFSVPEDIPG